MLLDNINCTTNENGIGEFLTYSMSPISLEIDQLPCYIYYILKVHYGLTRN
jgi:hypothetical protein